MIFTAMLVLGTLIGFVGTGGAGLTITLLTVGFGVPIHTALATALSSMVFTTLSGTLSHLRQHEVDLHTGLIIGGGGIAGSLIGTCVSDKMPSGELTVMTALMLLSISLIVYVKLYHEGWLDQHFPVRKTRLTGQSLYICGILTGIVSGFLAGAFGIGAAAYIQLALMVIFGIPLLEAIGTCMLVIIPISAAGGVGYFLSGHLVLPVFLQTLFGLMIGAWFGARLTHLAPLPLLKATIVAMPTVGGLLMLVAH